MSFYSLILIFIISVYASHASNLNLQEEGLKQSSFKHCPREMILAPLKELSDGDLAKASRVCKTFHTLCNVIFLDRLRQDPSSCWVIDALGEANWKMIYFEQRLFDVYIASQTVGGRLDCKQRHHLCRRFDQLKKVAQKTYHPLRPLLQVCIKYNSPRSVIERFDQEWQERITDSRQCALAHELRSYMYALDAVPDRRICWHWAVAALRDLFDLPIQSDPQEMFELSRACGITAANLGRPNALYFLITAHLDLKIFPDPTTDLLNQDLITAKRYYLKQSLMMKGLAALIATPETSEHFDVAMGIAKDLVRAGHPRAFQKLSLRYHSDASVIFCSSKLYKIFGLKACDALYDHVQSLRGGAPHDVRMMLARMYRAYLEKYPVLNSSQNIQKIEQLDRSLN